jgi:hypothetical protein
MVSHQGLFSSGGIYLNERTKTGYKSSLLLTASPALFRRKLIERPVKMIEIDTSPSARIGR